MPATFDMYESGVVRFGSFPSPAHTDFPDAPAVPVQVDFSKLTNVLAKDLSRRIARHLSFDDIRFTGVVQIGTEINDVIAAFLATRRRQRPVMTIARRDEAVYDLDGPTTTNGRCVVIAATTDDLRRYRQFAAPLGICGWQIAGTIALLGWGLERLHDDRQMLPPVYILETYENIAGSAVERSDIMLDVYRDVRDYPTLLADYLSAHEGAASHFPTLEPIQRIRHA